MTAVLIVVVEVRKHLNPGCNEEKRGHSILPARKELYFCIYETHMHQIHKHI